MEQEKEDQTKHKRKLNRLEWISVIGFVLLGIVLLYALIRSRSVYTSYEIVNTLSRKDRTSAYYNVMSNGMLRYSKDGAAMTDKKENLIWNTTYEMSSPKSVVNGSYTAIGDMGANVIYIFNEYGQIGHVMTDVPVQDIEISRQGVTAAILSDANNNYINLYDKQGKILGSIKASFENTGYPLDVALASDAVHMVVSYLCINKATVQTRVVTYDFSNIDGDHIVDNRLLDGLYPKIEFLNGTRFALFCDRGFSIYNNIGGSVTEVQSTVFENEIKSVFCENQKIGFIFNSQDDKGKYRMELYDISGRKNTTVHMDFDYDHIEVDDDEIILYNRDEVLIYQYDGKLHFDGMMEDKISRVMKSWEEGMYWLVEEQSLKEIQIK